MSRPVGQPLLRREDPRLLTGRGRYVADLRLPETVEAVVVRSPVAHARVRAVRTARAAVASGVHAVVTGDDLAAEGWLDAAQRAGARPPLAGWPEVCYVGHPVAVVVADSRYLAEDAAELVEVDYEPLPVIADIDAALAPGAPRVRADLESNVPLRQVYEYGDVEAAFRSAPLVVEDEFRVARASAHALETRGLVAAPDPVTGGLVVWAGTQRPHLLRRGLSQYLNLPEHAVRVSVPDVGGAFGSKGAGYPEEFLIAWLAYRLGRPVRWIEDRREHFVATAHAREQRHRVRVAAGTDGTLLAVDHAFWVDMGADARPQTMYRTATHVPGPYRLPAFRSVGHGVITHKTPFGPYRGAGREQGNFVMERMMDRLADAAGLDPAEVRRRNLLSAADLPYTTPLGLTYDSGDYPAALRLALEASAYDRWRTTQEAARRDGRWLGIGLAAYVEDTGSAESYEGAAVRVEPDGTVTAATGAGASGQGHETVFAQVVADALSVPLASVRVLPTDTAVVPLGIGTFGSRSAGVATAALMEACGRLRDRLVELAAAQLEAAPADLELADGAVRVRGAPARAVPLRQLAEIGNSVGRTPLPRGTVPGLEAVVYARGQQQFAYGVHVAVVEVDPPTGGVRLIAYTVVHDCGTLLNPLVVDGQVRGGVAQGLGTALLEELRYDADGQLLNGSYLDYLLPTLGDIPPLVVRHVESPSPFAPTGAKGAGEGGTIPALACVANAVEDALRPLGVRVRDLPITPDRLLAQLDGAAGGRPPSADG